LRLLILGSEGFIGKHCVSYFSQKSHEVYGVDLFERPTLDYQYFKVSRLSPELDELFSKVQFDLVINASGSASVPYSMTHPVLDFEANCLDTIRILDEIRKKQPECRYIHLSSAAVYGNPVKLPVSESDKLSPLSPYGWHKLISENLCREYQEIYGLKIAIVRPFSVYGRGLKKQLFWDVYQKVKAGKPFELFGTGMESRDFIYIDDVVEALEFISGHSPMNASVYNLASGIESRIADVVSLFFKHLNVSPDYQFRGEIRSGDPVNWRADVKLLMDLGFKTRLSLEDGISDLAAWIREV
jgi:dTDP-glucose 4,6-dehydratase/UDP-glucose 4-epimerase